jgi:hypothetical protein
VQARKWKTKLRLYKTILKPRQSGVKQASNQKGDSRTAARQLHVYDAGTVTGYANWFVVRLKEV